MNVFVLGAALGCGEAGQDGVPDPTTFRLSGTVSGPVVVGVNLALSGAVSRSTTTDALGAFAFEGLQAGDYTLTPTSRTVAVGATSVAGLDFGDAAIVAVTHWMTGPIGGKLVSGVRVDLGGAANGTTLTDAQGHYVFSGLADGVYTVTPTAQGGSFVPTSRQVTVAGVLAQFVSPVPGSRA